MASNRVFNILEEFLEYFDSATLLDEVFQGLSDVEAMDILDHIARMHDLPIEVDAAEPQVYTSFV
jgi:hypothetical protein